MEHLVIEHFLSLLHSISYVAFLNEIAHPCGGGRGVAMPWAQTGGWGRGQRGLPGGAKPSRMTGGRQTEGRRARQTAGMA